MPREQIALQVGQCGNQIGTEFWKRLCLEHGISNEGVLLKSDPFPNCKDVFFYQADDDHYVPRSIMIDMEPRVVNSILNGPYCRLFNWENKYVHKKGCGAGNNWAKGYDGGKEVSEEVFEIIDREAENSDSLEGFLLSHSIAGGTGSGFGSFILEELSDRYPKKVKSTFSVFPNQTKFSDVVVQPYNCMLSMKRLALCADVAIVIDNTALDRLSMDRFDMDGQSSIAHTNSLVATVMAASSSTIRFPNCMYNDLVDIASSLVPSPRSNFLITGFTPLPGGSDSSAIRKTSVQEVIRRLLQPRNIMASCNTRKGVYLSMLAVLQGDVAPIDLQKSRIRLREKKAVHFAKWSMNEIQMAVSKKSPFLESPHSVSGLMLANHTSIRHVFGTVMKQYDTFIKRKAFLQPYLEEKAFGGSLEEFNDSREVVKECIDEYEEQESPNYPNIGE